jgi:hypothetical protein
MGRKVESLSNCISGSVTNNHLIYVKSLVKFCRAKLSICSCLGSRVRNTKEGRSVKIWLPDPWPWVALNSFTQGKVINTEKGSRIWKNIKNTLLLVPMFHWFIQSRLTEVVQLFECEFLRSSWFLKCFILKN